MNAIGPGTKGLYLSPHFDDAAFSLGGWIADRPGGLLVNIFTRSEYTWKQRITGVEAVSAARAAEDAAFAARCGLEMVTLGLMEPSLLGRDPRDAAGLADDVARLRAPLTELLDARVEADTAVFCPAGIGGHVNHLATRLVAWDWATRRGRQRQMRFYEDLPYASHRRHRGAGIADLKATTAGWTLRRHAWRTGSAKLELVHLYRTQVDPRWSRRDFSPLALWPLGAHEAVWVPDREHTSS